MPSLLEEIADALARDVLRASEELGDDNLVGEISKVIGASSPTTQEAFMTAVRVRTAEQRARRALAERLGPRYAELVAEGRVAPAPSPVAVASPAPARAAPVARAPVEPAGQVPAAPPNVAPASVAARTEAPAPGLAEPPPETFVAAAQATPAEASLAAGGTPEAPATPGVRPRMAATLEKPAVTPTDTATAPPTPESLAAALALAASLPRREPKPAEPKPPVPPTYPDIEIPDGDWG